MLREFGMDIVSLFSGGLDSFVGVLDLLEKGRTVALVGHYGAGTTHRTQGRIVELLREQYDDRVTDHLFYIQPGKAHGSCVELTQRSRSVLFLALGVAVATAMGNGIPVIVAENGLISLNIPLTHCRMGSLSTRTTHPHFIHLFRQVIDFLGLHARIELPYCFQTKGEMLLSASNQEALRVGAKETMSCAHPEARRRRGLSPGKHCGYCLPCLIRRAAMLRGGIEDAEYDVDVRENPPGSDTACGRDLRAVQMAVERLRSIEEQQLIFRVLDAGPLPSNEIMDHVGVYSRGMNELRGFLEL